MANTSTQSRAKLQATRKRCQAIVDHPATNPYLRQVAQHKIEKIDEMLGSAEPATGYRLPDGWFGAKYDPRRSLTDVAKLVREEIKLLRKLGAMPADGALAVANAVASAPSAIRIGCNQPHYGSIRCVVKNVPAEWGWERRADRWGVVRPMPTAALQGLLNGLQAIMDAYNYDRSDAMVDHFDVNFYGRAEVDWREVPRD